MLYQTHQQCIASSLQELPCWDSDNTLNVVVETPKGSRNKLAWNEKYSIFELKGVLPAGAVFPFDFGFLPSTLGEDGDPLDILVLMDDRTYPGVLVPTRLLGVIEAEQTENGRTERNDRLIGVAANSRTHSRYNVVDELDENLLGEIEHFFRSYNEAKGKHFQVLGRGDLKRARSLIEVAQESSG